MVVNKKIPKIIFFLGIIFGFLTRTGFALALEVNYPKIFGYSVSSNSSLPEYFCYLLGLGTNLAFIVAVLVVAFGGVYYLVSYGRGGFTSEAKEWVKAGILGLLIVVCTSLIAHTINPNLTSCKMGILSVVNTVIPPPAPPTPKGVATTTYQEIPIGTLAENLLTRTMDCYGFDQNGNPVDSGTNGPTYLDHDRADCLLQVVDGAQKKAQVAAALSSEIDKLMQSCRCDSSKCDATVSCSPVGTWTQSNSCFNPRKCAPKTGGSCTTKTATNSPQDCCPEGVKTQIERGPINVSFDLVGSGSSPSCTTQTVAYRGLDEFRTQFNSSYSNIKKSLESQMSLSGKNVTVINKSRWNSLVIVDQLTYLKGKVGEITTAIQNDRDALNQAKTTLNNMENCYLAMPYANLLKIYTNTDQTKHVIITQKTFADPATKKAVDISRYCSGFGYANSSCFKKCNDICPDSSSEAMQAYRACTDEACMKKAYLSRPCTFGDGLYKNFGACITSCQNDCRNACGAKDASKCSGEYNFCMSQCGYNSQCILDNAGKCLIDAGNFITCGEQVADRGNANFCINNAYLCKNGSDQYADYPDCYSSPGQIKCNKPYNASSSEAGCQGMYPETAKCPVSSMCPKCTCDSINQSVGFSIPNQSTSQNAGNEGYSTSYQIVSSIYITGPQCNGYSYNDDPLTFYCEAKYCDKDGNCKDGFQNDPNQDVGDTPLAEDFTCKKDGEIPVGQVVDDSIKWADKLINDTNKITTLITPVINAIKKAGNPPATAKDYCKCEAKFAASATPICKSGCNDIQGSVRQDDQGNKTYTCGCSKKPCDGNACAQIINYLQDIWNNFKLLKNDFINFYTTMVKEPRSDIIKELTYSRQTANNCSLKSSAYGADVKISSCTIAKGNMVDVGLITFNSSVMSGCYGDQSKGGLGKEKNLTDNWFCCEKESQDK